MTQNATMDLMLSQRRRGRRRAGQAQQTRPHACLQAGHVRHYVTEMLTEL